MIYQAAYAMVARNEGERLYRGLREAVTEHLTNKVRALVLATVDESFLQTLNHAWEDHQRSMRMISNIVRYLRASFQHRQRKQSGCAALSR